MIIHGLFIYLFILVLSFFIWIVLKFVNLYTYFINWQVQKSIGAR